MLETLETLSWVPILASILYRDMQQNLFYSAREVLGKMLSLDPAERLSCKQCLEHPYFAAYHDPDDEPTALPFHEFDEGYSGDGSDVSIEQLKGNT